MDGFEKRRNQKKDAILNAASELFKLYGFNKVSIAEIAKKASASQVSIYNFFNSKENLRIELLIKLLSKHYQDLIDIIESENPLQQKIEELLATKIDFYESSSLLFFQEALDNSLINKNIQEIHNKFSSKFFMLFENGKKGGILDSSISSDMISTYFEMIEFYFTNNPSAAAKFKSNPRFANDFLTMLYNALKSKKQ